MQKRDTALVIVLMLLTCGLYCLYHAYVTTEEVKHLTGRQEINPGMELVINLITCGLFGLFIEYRNMQLIDQWYASHNMAHEEKANMVGLMNLLTFVVGVTWLVATFIYQDELNRAIDAAAALYHQQTGQI